MTIMDFTASEPDLEERTQPSPDLPIDAEESPSSEQITTMDFTVELLVMGAWGSLSRERGSATRLRRAHASCNRRNVRRPHQ